MSVAAMWFILGIILLAVELVSPVFVLFFFGLGAWAAGVTALFVDDLAIEVVVFGASSGGRQFLARGVPGSAAGGGSGACLGAYPR